MQTKLTLRMEENLIASAKRYSEAQGKSVSQLVSEFFQLLDSKEPQAALPPLVASLKGAAAGTTVDEQDYRRHLEAKHLG
jgi:hypothetical protein